MTTGAADPRYGPRRAAIDASSAILLHKTQLLDIASRHWRLLMAAAVFRELDMKGYPGQSQVRSLRKHGFLEVVDLPEGKDDHVIRRGLGAGEADSILLCARGLVDFVILDDGKGAARCRRIGVPHINALLVPKALFHAGVLGKNVCALRTEELITLGRYSWYVVGYARRCGIEEIAFFV